VIKAVDNIPIRLFDVATVTLDTLKVNWGQTTIEWAKNDNVNNVGLNLFFWSI
jgi:hypothetical protein